MTRVWLILGVINLALLIFAFIDVLLTPNWRVRGVPKIVWVFIVLLLTPIGALLWFFVGKEPTTDTPQRREIHPDDDPEFLAKMRMKDDQDERIRKLEQELAELDDDQPDASGNASK